MSQKTKRNLAAALVIALAAAACFCIIYFSFFYHGRQETEPTDSKPSATQKITENTTSDTTLKPTDEPTAPTQSPEDKTLNSQIIGKWRAVSAFKTSTGEEADLNVLYGSAFSDYGGTLELRSDSTFSLNIGYTDNDDSNNGKYTVSDGEISATFYVDRTIKLTPVFDGDTLAALNVPQYSYTVVFEKEA